MTIEEFIKSIGVPEDKQNEAVEAAKKFLDGDFVTKARFNEINEAKKGLTDQLADRDKQLSELKKSVGNNDDLKKQIEALQKANKEQKESSEKAMKELQLNTAIQLAIAEKAQDVEIVSGLFDKSKLILSEDGKVTGLTEQLAELEKAKPFLFKTGGNNPNYQPNGGGGKPPTTNPFKKESFNLTEQGKLLKTNPEQARALAAEAGVTI